MQPRLHRPGKDYMNLCNFRIFRTGAQERRGAAEGMRRKREPPWREYPTRNKRRTHNLFFSSFRCLSFVFYRQFSRRARMAFVVIYLMNPRLPWRPYRPGNPVRRAHPSHPAGRGHPSPMPNRSQP